jgi:hypothetical protein
MLSSSYQKLVFITMGVAMLGGVAVAFWPFVRAAWEIDRFCSQMPAGTPLAGVQARVEEAGYELSAPVEGSARVNDPISGGRRSCELHFDAQVRTTTPR